MPPFGGKTARQAAPQKTGLCGAPRSRAPAPPLRDVPPSAPWLLKELPFLRTPPIPCARTASDFRRMNRSVLRAPVGLGLCKTGFRGSPCYLDTTTRSMFRVRPWAPPLNWFPCKTVFRGSPCHLDTTTRSMFRVPDQGPLLNWIFVKPGSGARRAATIQQHTQRFAGRIGRIPRARTGHAARENRRGFAAPLNRFPVRSGSGARCAAIIQQHTLPKIP
jgi:hypothetical protein